MKKFYLPLLISLASVCSAEAAGYKSVVVNQTNGTLWMITMEENMTTKVTEGNLVLTCSRGDITFPVKDIANWTFSTDGGADDLWAGVNLPEGDKPGCVQEGDRIVLSNLPAGSRVMLASVDGRVVKAVSSVSGSYELSLVGLQSGVYVLTYNKESIKIAVAR